MSCGHTQVSPSSSKIQFCRIFQYRVIRCWIFQYRAIQFRRLRLFVNGVLDSGHFAFLVASLPPCDISGFFKLPNGGTDVPIMTAAYYFTLPMDGNNNSFPKHLWQPCKERRSFGVDVHHIVFSKCTIKCRKCGGADCSKSP